MGNNISSYLKCSYDTGGQFGYSTFQGPHEGWTRRIKELGAFSFKLGKFELVFTLGRQGNQIQILKNCNIKSQLSDIKFLPEEPTPSNGYSP